MLVMHLKCFCMRKESSKFYYVEEADKQAMRKETLPGKKTAFGFSCSTNKDFLCTSQIVALLCTRGIFQLECLRTIIHSYC